MGQEYDGGPKYAFIKLRYMDMIRNIVDPSIIFNDKNPWAKYLPIKREILSFSFMKAWTHPNHLEERSILTTTSNADPLTQLTNLL